MGSKLAASGQSFRMAAPIEKTGFDECYNGWFRWPRGNLPHLEDVIEQSRLVHAAIGRRLLLSCPIRTPAKLPPSPLGSGCIV